MPLLHMPRALAAVAALLIVTQAGAGEVRESYAAASASSREVGERYFRAYIDKRWDVLEPLLAEQGQFSDPTAALVFGSVVHRGKQAVMHLFRESYEPLSLSFVATRTLASGHHAIFEGELSWSMRLADRTIRTERMPLVTILTVENGQVVEHRDYADYHPFIAAEQETR